MSKRNLAVTVGAPIVIIALLVLGVWFFNRPASDGTLVYTWDEAAGGYSVSADRSVFGEELVIPASYDGKPVVAIENRAFEGCRGFKRVVIPETVKRVNYAAFKDCVDLEEVVWPSSELESLGNAAFSGCDSLKSIELPRGIMVVSNSLFFGCDALLDVVIPEGVLTVSDSAFARCPSIKSVSVPASLRRIRDSAFYKCMGLESLDFAEGSRLEAIDKNAFWGCEALKTVVFPEKLKTVGTAAFAYCGALEFVSFTGSDLTKIGASAFYHCDALDGVEIADIGNWCGVNFVGDDYSNPIYLGQKVYRGGELILRLEIPQGVERISARAFKNATRIVSVTLPDTLDNREGAIGDEAFLYCYKLVEIHNFSDLQLPTDTANYKKLGYITAYVSGNSGEKIGNVQYWSEEYPENGNFPYGKPGAIYEEKDAFKTDENGKRLYDTGIYRNGDYLFYKSELYGRYLIGYIGDESEISLPEIDGTYGIFTGAFFGQKGIAKVIVPDCVDEIGHYAFYSCLDLENIYIPMKVTSFGERLFGKCDALVIDLEAEKRNVGWKPNWADPTDKEIITVNYGKKKAELDWINQMP